MIGAVKAGTTNGGGGYDPHRIPRPYRAASQVQRTRNIQVAAQSGAIGDIGIPANLNRVAHRADMGGGTAIQRTVSGNDRSTRLADHEVRTVAARYAVRSEERRVGKKGVRKVRTGGWP